ncbi:MAG: TldD/PmbA family protein [Planctomycetota bacterium]|jgi:TldD protein
MPEEITRREFVRTAAAGTATAWLLGCASTPPPAKPSLWEAMADAALSEVTRIGGRYGDVRLLTTTRQTIRGRDRRIAGISDVADTGFGVRVLYNGAWGFAASCIMTPGEAVRVAKLAVDIARGSSDLTHDPVRLVDEPVHKSIVATPAVTDPFTVPLEQKTRLLLDAMEAMHGVEGVRRSRGTLWAQRDIKLFASTEGSRIRFNLLAVNGSIGATAVHDGRFASRTFLTPYLRTGYELVEQADLVAEAKRVAEEAVEKVKAPAVDAGPYDLVLDPAHLALTIHETCGHPTELDRALGYEANYAGTSFLTPDKLGRFRYGSRQVTLVADNTELGTLAATGYDDDGVACQRWDIVREGLFYGYSTSREVAGKIGRTRSRGSNRADSWKSIPIVRIANIGLEPGDGRLDDMIADVKKGIWVEGRGSFSIDQKRYNFQFGGDAFWLIENGKRKHMLRDVIYHGITPEFWGKCDAVADREHRQRFGFITCGKGQPGQSGWMTHAASPARFRGVDVITGGAGA